MAQTTLPVERAWKEQVDSSVCGMHIHSVCIKFTSLEAQVAYRGSLGNFWKMAITTLNLEAIF